MNFDISQVLERWPYSPGEVQVRKFLGKDGGEKIQLRVDLGILQMNAEGRPDGKRPLGHESWLDYYHRTWKRHTEGRHGCEESFALNSEDCARLQQEAIQYYHRYICLFQLNDFAGVLRDTERNLEAFKFVEQYAESPELAAALLQFKPQLVMMRARAQSVLALEEGNHAAAVDVIQSGIAHIHEFYRQQSRPDSAEQSGELHLLESWLCEVQARRPLSEREKLEKALHEAVGREDYERAAQVRDALRNLKGSR